MAKENEIQFKYVVDYQKAIKDLKWLRDNAAETTEEFEDMQREIDELTASMNELTGASLKTSKSMKSEASSVRETTKAYKNKQKELQKTFDAHYKVEKSVKSSVKEYGGLINTQAQLKNSTGASTSAALELGRVIQDAPYGIRGMGNNITQLASQMAFATKTAGGFSIMLRQMWTALMGPLGVVLGISAAVSALEFFNSTAKKSEKSANELSDAYSDFAGRAIGSFKMLLAEMNDLNNSEKQRIEAIDEMKKKHPAFIESINEEEGSYKATNKQIREYIKLLSLRARARAAEKIALEKNIKLIGLEEARRLEIKKKSDELIKEIESKGYDRFREGSEDRVKELVSFLTKEFDVTKKFHEQSQAVRDASFELSTIQDYRDELGRIAPVFSEIDSAIGKFQSALSMNGGEIESLNKEIGELIETYTKGVDLSVKVKSSKVSKESIIQTPEEFETNAVDLESKLLAFQQRLAMIDAKDKEERLAIENDFEVKSLRLTVDSEKKKAKIRFDEYANSIREKINLGKIDKVEGEDAISRAKENSEREVEAIEEAYEPLFGFLEKIFLARKKAVGGDEQGLIDIETSIGYFKNLYSGLNDFLAAEAEREMTMERNKTNSLNTELNNRLLNENLSKDERKRIQNEIWKNDEKLRVKQDEVKKKQFKSQKAFNISMALADTYLSATKAYASQLIPGDPTSIVRAKIAAAVATTTGLLNVAMIARQKFQPSASNTPISVGGAGGGGGGVGDRDFNFNIVGGDRENQLVGAIQEQFDKPLKAFVVSKDVTTQQQLDANTRTSASF